MRKNITSDLDFDAIVFVTSVDNWAPHGMRSFAGLMVVDTTPQGVLIASCPGFVSTTGRVCFRGKVASAMDYAIVL